jgi:hypothetical protein
MQSKTAVSLRKIAFCQSQLRGNGSPVSSSSGVLEPQFSAENPSERNPGLKCIQTNTNFKKFDLKGNKNKNDPEILWTSYISNETIYRPFQSRETIPLIFSHNIQKNVVFCTRWRLAT